MIEWIIAAYIFLTLLILIDVKTGLIFRKEEIEEDEEEIEKKD